ncbi:condensation domain-containing protein, partial [Streptomyces capoamus]
MIPLSFAQRRLWFIHRLEGPSPTYNMAAPLRLVGDLDVDAMREAVRDVVTRHETLRTLYAEDAEGTPFQRIVPAGDVPVELPVLDTEPHEVEHRVRELVTHCFDLTKGEFPLRTTVLRCGPRDHVLVLAVHHIAADGGSAAPLARDLVTAYAARREGRAPGWADLPVQYKDYTLWQRELLGDEDDPDSVAAGQVSYWRDELAGVVQPTRLPLDRPRPPVAGHHGDLYEFKAEPRLMAGLEKLAAERGATVSMAVQAAIAVLLHRLGAGDDLTIGSPIAGRVDEALADLVGCFVNTWVLRLDLSGEPSFSDLLRQTRSKALAAYDNQDIPFDRLVEVLNPERSTSYQPLFQVMTEWQTSAQATEFFSLAGLEVSFLPLQTESAKFDLLFSMGVDTGGGMHCSIQYATDLFHRRTIEAMGDRFLRVLEQVVDDPYAPVRSVDVLSGGEWEWLVRGVNDTGGRVPVGTLVSAF